MSIQHVGAVLNGFPELDQVTAFVLIAIADGANRDNGWSYTTVDAMARAARCKRRSVFYALKTLVSGGYLRAVGKPGRASKYRVLFDYGAVIRPESELYPTGARRAPVAQSTGAPGARGGAPGARGGAPHDAPPNNPPIGITGSLPVSNRGDEQKLARGKTKKIPKADPPQPRDLSDEKRRQLAELRARATAAVTP